MVLPSTVVMCGAFAEAGKDHVSASGLSLVRQHGHITLRQLLS